MLFPTEKPLIQIIPEFGGGVRSRNAHQMSTGKWEGYSVFALSGFT